MKYSFCFGVAALVAGICWALGDTKTPHQLFRFAMSSLYVQCRWEADERETEGARQGALVAILCIRFEIRNLVATGLV